MGRYYWLNDDSITFLKRGYLYPGVEPKERIKQIAQHAENALGIDGFADKFEEYMARGYFSLATPIWLNLGLERGLGISCFGISIEDKLSDIFRALGEIGTMTSKGGGTAGYIGNLRPRGAAISNGGSSGGAVHFLEAFQSVSSVVTQGEARRGHFAAYLPIDHPDIEEFLNCRTEGHPIQTLSTAVTVKDYWMEEMIKGDSEKQRIWAKVLQRRAETGYPFLFFHDNVNRDKPQVYKDKGMEIKHSQMCVTGDQLVPTSKGIFSAYELYKTGESLTLFDNEKEVQASPMKLIEKDAAVYTIYLDNGMTHTVTDYHKVKTVEEVSEGGLKVCDVQCKDLEIGSQVAIQNSRGLFGSIEHPFELQGITAYEAGRTLTPLSSTFYQATEKVQWSYIDGVLSRERETILTLDSSTRTYCLEFKVGKQLPSALQIILSNLGVLSTVEEGSILVTDLQSIKTIYENTTSLQSKEKEEHLQTLLKVGQGRPTAAKVVKIEPAGTQDVYCVTVDTPEHYWVCNGVITHNCTEIIEYTDEQKSFTCCLSSINLVHIDEILKTDAIQTLTYFLDSVLTDFIHKASNVPFMEKAVRFAQEHRSIGLGVLGWHSYLQSRGIAFDSFEAHLENTRIFKAVNDLSLQASRELALKFGEPAIMKGTGERFSTRIAIAPTTSSSFILGQVSPSIEPLASNYFVKNLSKGKFTYKNPYLQSILEELGKDTAEVWRSIAMKGGSVQHLDFLTPDQKDVFKTFSEISQMSVITQAAARQKYIDQAQSLNLMIHPETPVREINQLIIKAWQSGIKTLYYQRSANLAQQVSRNLNECVSCES